jgi:hypothetical protein
MLDFMRKQRSKLKWVWAAVIFVRWCGHDRPILPFGDMGRSPSPAMSPKSAAKRSRAAEFQTAYANYLRSNAAESATLTEILKAFGFDKQIAGLPYSRQKSHLNEAKRLGLQVTTEELTQSIITNPNFRPAAPSLDAIGMSPCSLRNNLKVEQFETTLRGKCWAAKVRASLRQA